MAFSCDMPTVALISIIHLQVHGGTTENDVKEFVSVVEKEAKRNMEQGIDTIAFFDEANTTDAIGLIKEVMCDCRMNGRPIFEHLKFIAACNPYRKYLKTQSRCMIDKLSDKYICGCIAGIMTG